MATFSQRLGLTPLHKQIQTESLDESTRNRIWNTIYYSKLAGNSYFNERKDTIYFRYERIWNEHLKLPPNTTSRTHYQYHQLFDRKIQEVMREGQWYEVLNFLEFVVQKFSDEYDIAEFNEILETENTGYRIINREITPITSQVEIENIEEAISSRYDSINSHFGNALKLLSDRKTPDYANSIKESISAVEALCKIISGDKKGTLGKCLKKIAQNHPIPKSLEMALNALYGYTSDEGGIRHALTEDSTQPTFADAKFMLVSCTAFVNYLLTIAAEENISLSGE